MNNSQIQSEGSVDVFSDLPQGAACQLQTAGQPGGSFLHDERCLSRFTAFFFHCEMTISESVVFLSPSCLYHCLAVSLSGSLMAAVECQHALLDLACLTLT